MRDANMPKFLARDAALLASIITDQFPGVDATEQVKAMLQLVLAAP